MKDWRRLLLSPLHHVDDWHLYFNMASFLWKGIRLEQRLGGAWFLYLLSVFSLLTGLVYLALEAALTELAQDQSYSLTCAVGFSGKESNYNITLSIKETLDPNGQDGSSRFWHVVASFLDCTRNQWCHHGNTSSCVLNSVSCF